MKMERVAFVTGGARGIGAAICRSLAQAGHRVAVADLNIDLARETAEEIGGVALELDVRDQGSVATAMERCREQLGAPNVLVNNAGWDQLMGFMDTTEEFSSQVIEINYSGVVRMCRAALPGMIEAGWGRVINIGSDAGRVGSSNEAVYSGAKGATIAFSKTIAREFAKHGITVNVVCPGPTDTPLLTQIIGSDERSDDVISSIKRQIPMRRLGRPEDFGPAVAFFASDGAGFITGQTLSVSGGLTMA